MTTVLPGAMVATVRHMPGLVARPLRSPELVTPIGFMAQQGVAPTRALQAALQLDAPLTEDGAMAKRIAQQMAKADPQIASEDVVVVVLAYGYDMGIATGWRRHGYSFGAEDLR